MWRGVSKAAHRGSQRIWRDRFGPLLPVITSRALGPP